MKGTNMTRYQPIGGPFFGLASVILVGFVLASCALPRAETPAQRLFALQADYVTVLTVAAEYESLPRCSAAPPPCSTGAIVEKIRGADDIAFAAISVAKKALGEGDAVERSLAAASAAVAALSALIPGG